MKTTESLDSFVFILLPIITNHEGMRYMHGSEFSRTVQAMGFPVQEARPHEAARNRLITNPWLLVWQARLAQQLFHAVKGSGDLTMVPDFTLTPRFSDGDCKMLGMDIEARTQYFFCHKMGCVGFAFATGSSGSSPTPLPEHRNNEIREIKGQGNKGTDTL
jgi:hypothetical protein